MSKIRKIVKGITVILIGFIVPVHSLVNPDTTRYKCTLKGVRSINTGYLETWSGIRQDFLNWVKE